MKALPIGVDDFKKLRDQKSYYVDKSGLITKILSSAGTEAFLFTRPRRFGKSINISMLDAYLNQNYPQDNGWFDGLRVTEDRPDDPEKNSNVVISICMKDVGIGTYSSFLNEFMKKAAQLYSFYPELKDSPKVREALRGRYSRIVSETPREGDLTTCISDLSEMLTAHHGKKAIILIDEYDNPINGSSGTDRKEILLFLRQLYGSALKGNGSLRFAVVTGIMRISKESIFSGTNNLWVDDVFTQSSPSSDYSEFFGFTSDEVRSICEDYGGEGKFDEAKSWYDGYRFGDAEIYNPWSILSYVESGFRPDVYWAGTSGNEVIDRMLRITDRNVVSTLRSLLSGQSVSMPLDTRVTFADLSKKSERIFPILVMSGYLRAERVPGTKDFRLTIPNHEVADVFSDKIMDNVRPVNGDIEEFARSLIDGNVEQIDRSLRDLMLSASCAKMFSDEHTYQALVLGMLLNLRDLYHVDSEGRAGKGYYDLCMRSRNGDRPNILIEFKKRKKGDSPLDVLAQNGLKQIHDREYYHDLEGTTMLYGMALDKMDMAVAMDTVSR